jgi:cell division septation protein DedD
MRPDLDDYEDLNTDNDGAPQGRAMSWLVLGVAVIGFAALAYYAYQSGSQTGAEGEMITVEAQDGAIKEAPADPGGEQFPHKDKTIYDALSPYRTDEQKVEKLLPEPEEPVIPEPAVGDAEPDKKEEPTTSYVNGSVDDKQANEVNPATDKKPNPVEAVTPLDKVAKPIPLEPVEVKDQPVATKTVTVAKEPAPKPTAKPAPVKVEPKPIAKAEPVKTEPQPAASGGNYKIQLGAYKSDEEARQSWSKITAKHGDIVKGSAIVVKADLPAGTFYRLRAGGFSSADAAKKACSMLSGRGQACFYAGQ